MKVEPSVPPQCKHCNAMIENCDHCGEPSSEMICFGPVGGPMNHFDADCFSDHTLYYPEKPPPMTPARRERLRRISSNLGPSIVDLLATGKFCESCTALLKRRDSVPWPCAACMGGELQRTGKLCQPCENEKLKRALEGDVPCGPCYEAALTKALQDRPVPS